jgi:hypothetical protein
LLPDARSREAVELAEQLADGAIKYDRLRAVLSGPNQPRSVVHELCLHEAWSAASLVLLSSYLVVWDAFPASDSWEIEQKAKASLLVDTFGNPFRSTLIQPHLMRSHKRRAMNLAHEIYDGRGYDKLPNLANALEEAGCTDREIVCHCRRAGEHVRGCWVVDLLLGKS